MNMSHAKQRTIKRNTLKPDVSISKPKLNHMMKMAKTVNRIRKEQRHASVEENARKLNLVRVRVFNAQNNV